MCVPQHNRDIYFCCTAGFLRLTPSSSFEVLIAADHVSINFVVEVVANRIRRERSDRQLRRERKKQHPSRVDGSTVDAECDSEARGLLAASDDSESGEEQTLNESVGLGSSCKRHNKSDKGASDEDCGFGTTSSIEGDENVSASGAAAAAAASAQAREKVSVRAGCLAITIVAFSSLGFLVARLLCHP